MFKNILKSFALVALLGAVNSASAITIAGQEYDKFLEIEVDDKLGYWVSMQKFHTYPGNSVDVDDVKFRDAALNGYDIEKFYAMGTATQKNFATGDSPVGSGVVNLWGDNHQLLLSASYASNGFIDSTRINGDAGQVNITGLYTLTGGIFHTLGLIDGPIYVALNYDRVTAFNHVDIHATNGTITFYQKSNGGGTEVPEPGTVALLAASLLGAGRVRQKKNA